MSQRTPTPWHYESVADCSHAHISSAIGEHGDIATCWLYEADTNAAFIVKAVNSHDALVKALKNARNCIDTLIVNSLDKKKRRNLGEFIQEIDNALATIKENA